MEVVCTGVLPNSANFEERACKGVVYGELP